MHYIHSSYVVVQFRANCVVTEVGRGVGIEDECSERG